MRDQRFRSSVFRVSVAVTVALVAPWAAAQEDGDALQLQTFVIESSADQPTIDGPIAPAGTRDDWKAASARKLDMATADNSYTAEPIVLFANTDDSLFIGVVITPTNNGAGNGFSMYFDLDNDGVLEAGDYAISSAKADNTSATFKEYEWDGSAWQELATTTTGLVEGFIDNGAMGNHVFNFEIQIPMVTTAPVAGQAFFNAQPGDEVGIMVVMDALDQGSVYWEAAGTSVTDASGWGDLLITGSQASPRRLASLYAKSYVPTIDGDISNDANWQYGFEKTVVFTDFAGNKLENSKIYLKEDGGNLYFGARITDNVENAGDYFQVYFDQGNNGGAANYQLNVGGSAQLDDALRVAGDGSRTDLYFNGSAWTADGTANGSVAAGFVSGTAWEFELSRALSSGDANDLDITSGDEVGVLFRYHDADNSRDYWWSAEINDDVVNVDVSGVENALGWGELVTGGPFVQPLYPEQGDIISGTYVLMLYTEDAAVGSGWLDVDSVDYRITDLDDNIVINYSSSTEMTRVDNDNSGVWVATFNTNTGSTPDGDYNIVFRVLDDDGIRVTSPVLVTIQNTGTVGGPTVTVNNLGTGDVVSGDTVISYTVNPTSGDLLVKDSIQVRIDGGTWTTVDTALAPATTGGTGTDTLRSGTLVDGVHTIRYRAKDTGGETWGYSEQIIFNVDNDASAAKVTITAPADSAVKSDTVDIAFTVVAPVGRSITTTEIAVDGVNWAATTTDSTHQLDTKGYPDGTHLIQVRVSDDLGRSGYSQPIAIVVNNAPSVTLDSPTGGATVSGKVELTYTATPTGSATIDSTWLMVDGAFSQALDASGTDSLDTGPLTDGEHTLQVRVIDDYGKMAVSEIVTVLVRNAPTAVIDTPLAGAEVSGETRLVYTLTPKGTAAIDSAWLLVDGGFSQSLTAGDGAQADTVNTTSLPDGEHTIQIAVRDDQGKQGMSKTLTLVVRNAPTVVLTAPEGGAKIWGGTELRYTLTPKGTALIDTAWLMVDGKFWKAVDTGGVDTLNTLRIEDGEHTLQVRARDDQGKTGSSELITVMVRNAPEVIVTAPDAGAALNGTITVAFQVTVPGDTEVLDTADIDSAFISVDGGDFRPTATKASDTIDTRVLKDGSHIYKLRVYVNGGKRGDSDERLIVVDNTAPMAADPKAIYGPDNDAARVGDSVAITVLVNEQTTVLDADSGVVLVADSIDSAGPTTVVMADDGSGRDAVAGDNVFTATVKVATSASGTSGYSITATDSLGNAVTLTGAVKLDNALPVVNFALLSPEDSAAVDPADTTYFEYLIMNAEYLDPEGGAGLKQVYVTVGTENDSNVANSPVVLSTEHTKTSLAINLAGGPNVIRLVAEDRAGNVDTVTETIVNLDMVEPEILEFRLVPDPDTVSEPGLSLTYFDKLVLKARYSDAGGSGLSRVFVTVLNDSGDHVNNSPIELSTEDTMEVSRIVNLVPGVNFVTMTARDHSGNETVVADTVEYREPKATAVLTREGGTLTSPDGAAVEVPKDALLSPVEITITKVLPIDQPKPLDEDLVLLNVAHDFGPDGTVFRKPVTITLPYTEADLDKDQDGEAEIDPTKLAVVFWNGTTWRRVGEPDTIDTVNRLVTVSVNHFTMYDLAVDNGEKPKKLRAYWTQNPVKRSGGAEFAYELPKDGKVSLHILDLAGDVVYRFVNMDGGAGKHEGEVVWTGQNVSGQFAGSGLYVYVFTYVPDGENKPTIIRKPVGLLNQ